MNQLFNNVIVKIILRVMTWARDALYLDLEKAGPNFKPSVYAFVNIAHRYRDKETHHNGLGGLHWVRAKTMSKATT